MPDERSVQPLSFATGEKVTPTGQWLILITAFLGWLFAGMILSTTSLAMRAAAIDLLSRTEVIDLQQWKTLSTQLQAKSAAKNDSTISAETRRQYEQWSGLIQGWFAYYQCAFLFGAALGGLVFGRIGDQFGRSTAMGWSIVCYSGFSALTYFVVTPWQLLIVWFLGCLGVGGMWPNGVALVAEAWSSLSRPLVAGLMGMSANIGIFLLATLAALKPVTHEEWRWIMVVGAIPVVLGVVVLLIVPESPVWRRAKQSNPTTTTSSSPPGNVFSMQYIGTTLLGITLATVPLIGGWGSANWMVPWSAQAGEALDPPNPYLKAWVSQARAFTGTVGSFLGGWVAHHFGRRLSYCLVSLAALFCAQVSFWFRYPTDPDFLFWVGGLGFFSGIYFGWLPLFLPELFPTRIRSTGAGVSFNFGRIVTAFTVFATGALTMYFGENYPLIGRITSLIFAVGVVVIWFAPDTSKRRLEE